MESALSAPGSLPLRDERFWFFSRAVPRCRYLIDKAGPINRLG